MIKTWYEEYEKIKDKAIVVFGYEWESMADEQKEKILAEKKTVIMSGDSGYACKRYQIIGNANNLSDHECAIIADGGNLCFGYRMEGQGNRCIHRLKEDNMEAREEQISSMDEHTEIVSMMCWKRQNRVVSSL